MPKEIREFIDRIVRPVEAKVIHGYSNVHMRRLEDAGKAPKRMKLRPDSGPYGATGYMLSELLNFNRWRAAGCPCSWAEWSEATSKGDDVADLVATKAHERVTKTERDDVDADGKYEEAAV